MGLKESFVMAPPRAPSLRGGRFAPGPSEPSSVVLRGPPPVFRLAQGELTRWVIVYGSCDNGTIPFIW